MAGRPFRQKVLREIETRGGIDWVLGEIADGRSLLKIAKQDLNCSRNLLDDWLRETPERWAAVKAARKRSADAKWEEAEDEIEKAHGEFAASGVQARIGAAKHKVHMATVLDRETYGEPAASTALQVNVSIGALHLSAHRERQAEARLLPGPVVDRPELIELEGP